MSVFEKARKWQRLVKEAPFTGKAHWDEIAELLSWVNKANRVLPLRIRWQILLTGRIPEELPDGE